MKVLYPELEPHAILHLQRDRHQVYVEECGNPDGIPVVFLHGGPGSGCRPHHRRFFDPERYRIVLLDQRGSGRSTPHGELRNNTTPHLLRDLEYIRRRLEIERWLLFAGSWGATLALLYAEAHPARVSGMVLRGTFLARECDLHWFAGEGANRIYPERWHQFLQSLPEAEHSAPLPALHQRLLGKDELAQRRAARAWNLWSSQVALGDAFEVSAFNEHVPAEVLHKARMELHYAVNRYFIGENQILDHCGKLADIPAILIHGRRDLVCLPEAAYGLHQRLSHSSLRILPHAGHISAGQEMIDALVAAADEMAERLAP